MRIEEVISIQLKRFRKTRELTQEEISQLANVDVRHYQRLEAGEKLASLTTLFKLSMALSIDPQELINPAWTAFKKSPPS